MNCALAALRNFNVLIVAGQQVDARDVVASYHTLDLVENGHRIERRHLRLKVMRLEPDGVAGGLPRLRAAALTHVRVRAAAEGNEAMNIKGHGIGDAHNHLEVRLAVADL